MERRRLMKKLAAKFIDKNITPEKQDQSTMPNATPTDTAGIGKETSVSDFNFFVPANKVPESLKESKINDNISLTINGKIQVSDETGLTINIESINV